MKLAAEYRRTILCHFSGNVIYVDKTCKSPSCYLEPRETVPTSDVFRATLGFNSQVRSSWQSQKTCLDEKRMILLDRSRSCTTQPRTYNGVFSITSPQSCLSRKPENWSLVDQIIGPLARIENPLVTSASVGYSNFMVGILIYLEHRSRFMVPILRSVLNDTKRIDPEDWESVLLGKTSPKSEGLLQQSLGSCLFT